MKCTSFVIALISLGGGAAIAVPRVAHATVQSPQRGPVSGSVRDSSGAAIAGAEVSIAGTGERAETGDDGLFRLNAPSRDSLTIRVRRLGFQPAALALRPASDTAPLRITLAALSQSLRPVVVVGGRNIAPDRLQGFAERRREGNGRFFTHEDFEQRHIMRVSDLMRQVPGVTIARNSYPQNAVRFRGQACAPLTWLDGFPLLAGEFDLDALVTESIEAMEVYSGPATMPLRFRGPVTSEQCGVIVIWSRTGLGRPRDSGDRSVAAEIAKLVEEQKVFTADQVDVPAHFAAAVPVSPGYPDSLYAAHVSGVVVAEFVVEPNGEVARDQITIVSSTHPLFSDAVAVALPRAKFIGGQKGGRGVRQVVQWTFRFSADSPVPTSDAAR